jgi:hypothetical protein
VIRDNSVVGNNGIGIFASGTVIGNHVSANSGLGLSFSALSGGYTQNVFRGNNGPAGSVQVSGGINLGQNVCQTATSHALCP